MAAQIKAFHFRILIGIILVLTSCSFAINLYYQFPGNNYIPVNTYQSALSLILIFLGCRLSTGKNSPLTKRCEELIYFFAIMFIIALATNAVQLTPFNNIDTCILKVEQNLNIDLQALMLWTNQQPNLHYLLSLAYGSLPWQMTIIPLVIILLGKYHLIREYYFLMLASLLFGFLVYYFFPTMAPASILPSHYFNEDQLATALKFKQIHQHIAPTTNNGGLIAFPSFHAIWAWLCLYLVRPWRIASLMLCLWNLLLISACVLLGWHYFLDIVMSMVILLICHCCLRKCHEKTSEPQQLVKGSDSPIISLANRHPF